MTSHDVILAHWTACTEASRRNHAECSPSRNAARSSLEREQFNLGNFGNTALHG